MRKQENLNAENERQRHRCRVDEDHQRRLRGTTKPTESGSGRKREAVQESGSEEDSQEDVL